MAIHDAGTKLNRDVLLVQRAFVSGPQLEALEHAGAVHPVFRHGTSLTVVLPEVRVEDPSPRRRQAVHQWLRKNADVAEIVHEQGDRIDLQPTSGRGADALDLANRLTEEVGPELAQARLLHIVER
jgi:hypothetical protein